MTQHRTSKDELGDRMKAHEAVETHRQFDPTRPVYARIDGRSFSKFTKNMERPFDLRMTSAMIDVTAYLVEQTHAAIGYVQSDEISLLWADQRANNGLFFAGKVQKSCSVLASMAAARFAVALQDHFGSLGRACPHFDCRVIQMPDRTEAANMLLWRALDARKNAVSMLARHHFSHGQLQNQGQADMLAMLAGLGVTMDQQPVAFARGTYLQRVTEDRLLTPEELESIPAKHRPDPTVPVARSRIQSIAMPPFISVSNRAEVIFDGAAPIVS